MPQKIAVVLAGAGVYDGSELHEAVLTLLALEQAGFSYQCMAPNIDQMHVIDHLRGEPTEETRNVLVESARIARGDIIDIANAQAEDYDAVVTPGGFGAAKNLCDFAVNGAAMTINKDYQSFVQAIHKQNKPVVLICIAPVMSALLLGENTQCTIGTDEGTASAINTTGAEHKACPVEEAIIDHDKKLITTPAYMLAGSISEANASIQSAINALNTMLKS